MLQLHEVQKELEDVRKNRTSYQKENHNNPLREKEEMYEKNFVQKNEIFNH